MLPARPAARLTRCHPRGPRPMFPHHCACPLHLLLLLGVMGVKEPNSWLDPLGPHIASGQLSPPSLFLGGEGHGDPHPHSHPHPCPAVPGTGTTMVREDRWVLAVLARVGMLPKRAGKLLLHPL